MADAVRLGIVGCGAVTERHHLPALTHTSKVRVVALADADRSRLERLGGQYQVPLCYATCRELIEDAKVDAVAVCLPPQLHAEVALAALEQGKHVFIEKPIALNLPDCDRLIEKSKRDPLRKVMVGFNLRFHRLVSQARRIIKRDELGQITLVRTVFTAAKPSGASGSTWRTSPGTGGGLIFDLGVHHFDLVRFLSGGEVEEVYASSTGFDKTATVMFSLSNGARGVSVFAQGTGDNQAFEIYGDHGWLRVCLYRADGLERYRLEENPGAITTRLRAAVRTVRSSPGALYRRWRGGDFLASYVEEWNHFGEAVLLDATIESDLTAGRRAMEIALAATKAVETQRPCAVEPNS